LLHLSWHRERIFKIRSWSWKMDKIIRRSQFGNQGKI